MISLSKQPTWTLQQLRENDLGKAVVWVTPSVRSTVTSMLRYPVVEPMAVLPEGTQTLIVVGGGYLIDEAKAWVQDQAPTVKLIAVPSLWGSGAEASPIIVQNRDGKKKIRMSDAFLPHARVVWPDLIDSLPEARAKEALGDTWSNALEGFFSPLAKPELRVQIAELIKEMVKLPLGKDKRWFELSSHASAAQAQSSVGLVHGFAHTLEGPLIAAQPQAGWGHARLCATYLWPVLRFNFQAKPALKDMLTEQGINPQQIETIAHSLYSEANYDAALPLLSTEWPNVLRDQCTRTNPVLVRGSQLEFFTAKRFHDAPAGV